jgi:hypothetical protein
MYIIGNCNIEISGIQRVDDPPQPSTNTREDEPVFYGRQAVSYRNEEMIR